MTSPVGGTAAGQAAGGSWSTLQRGLSLLPGLRTGFLGTLALALVAMVGRAAVPIAVQQGIDHGLRAPAGPDVEVVAIVVAATVAALSLTTLSQYLMVSRLFTVSETALAVLRARTFRHIHDLSMLHQQARRRGTLTARVTTDVDQITQFVQFGGVTLLVSTGQIVVTVTVMLVYSWPLALVVLTAFIPFAIVVRLFQRRLARAYGLVRQRVGHLLGAIGESIVGAEVIRSYGVAGRTASRLDCAIDEYRTAQYRALRTSVISFSAGELTAGLATASVVVVGVLLGVGGGLSVGQLTAFLFLAALFVQPVQIASEVLNEAQNALAGTRRVLDILDLPTEVADPGTSGRDLPAGPLDVSLHGVGFAYPFADDEEEPTHVPAAGAAPAGAKVDATVGACGAGRAERLGPEVLSDVELTVAAKARVAVVGETGSGKTTFAKLVTRLMDPTRGEVRVGGVALPRVRFASLRNRVVMVPQDGFLFDTTVAENIALARPGATPAELDQAVVDLGLADWVASLPAGLQTRVGERGEALSVGERQLVALIRAYLADPDLLVLDEATSAVDPATEVRLQRALDAVTRGRTTIAIAHRLSTAEAADEVVVFDRGRIVQRGPHALLVVEADSVYAHLHAAWVEQTQAN